MAKLEDFDDLQAVEAWVTDRLGQGVGGKDDHELALDLIAMLRRFGYDEPKSPTKIAIEEEDRRKAFIAELDKQPYETFAEARDAALHPAFTQDAPQRCPAIWGGRRCVYDDHHGADHVYGAVKDQHTDGFLQEPARTQVLNEVYDGAVLDHSVICGRPVGSLGVICNRPQGHLQEHQWSRDRENQRLATARSKPLLGEADPELERLLVEEDEILRRTREHHENKPFRRIPEEKANTQLPQMVPGAPPLAPSLRGKTVLPDMGGTPLPAHGTQARYDDGCRCEHCLEWGYDDYEPDYYEPEPEEFDD